MADSEEFWTAEYQNILEFYFWEPQHLNRVSPAKELRRPVDDVIGRLMKREVPLNHLLNIFFRLAPDGLIGRWVASALPSFELGPARLTNTIEFRRSQAYGACQPDIWLEGTSRRCFVELKVDAKGSLQQVFKYALLAKILDREYGVKPAALVLMGPSAAHFATMADDVARRTDAASTAPATVIAHAARLGIDDATLIAAARSLSVGYSAYGTFETFLSDEQGRATTGEAAETLVKLIAGMRAFLSGALIKHVGAP
jgi:hypothetical protein